VASRYLLVLTFNHVDAHDCGCSVEHVDCRQMVDGRNKYKYS
jgi:hypothetical protein